MVKDSVLEASRIGKSCLVAFDLDSTLFTVVPRLHQVMQNFAKDSMTQKRFPELIEKIRQVEFVATDWGIEGALLRAGLHDHSEEFSKLAHDFWYDKYFSNAYLQYDEPYDGAPEFIQQIWAHGAHIAYITGRDVARMGEGSVSILKKWGFPVNQERAELVLKPEKGMNDARFKTDWFKKIPAGAFSKIYFFENEPVNLHAIVEDCPDVEILFFESTHSGKASASEAWPKIRHFNLTSQKKI